MQYLIHCCCRWPGIFVRLRWWFTESIIYFTQHYSTVWNGNISTI